VWFSNQSSGKTLGFRPRRVEGRTSGFRGADFARIFRDSSCFAFSSPARRDGFSPFPARLMK
jgi:hypothetical protein